jgi:hypothetical protein
MLPAELAMPVGPEPMSYNQVSTELITPLAVKNPEVKIQTVSFVLEVINPLMVAVLFCAMDLLEIPIQIRDKKVVGIIRFIS